MHNDGTTLANKYSGSTDKKPFEELFVSRNVEEALARRKFKKVERTWVQMGAC